VVDQLAKFLLQIAFTVNGKIFAAGERGLLLVLPNNKDTMFVLMSEIRAAAMRRALP
jgi:hypothetical protein